MRKVLILGGGFAGIEAAIFLRKRHYNVTLVSDRDYFYIYPTSIWIPTGKASFEDVCIDLNQLATIHGFSLIVDEVTLIDSQSNTITLGNYGIYREYDYLILAMGAHKIAYQGIENTLSICGDPKVSLQIRDALNSLIAKGSGTIAMGFGSNPNDSSAVRGGPGFELLFNIHHLLVKKGIRDRFDLNFFAPMKEPGARMGSQALRMMDRYFSRLNITRYFGKKITAFTHDGIVFEDDSQLKSDLTLFIPAGDGHAVLKASDLPLNEAGFVRINDFCEVPNDAGEATNVYAIGDCAALEGPAWRAKQGHIAEVMARLVAFNMAARDSNVATRQGYREHLNILCIMDSGDGAAFVYRDDKRALMIPLPVVGHWMKKGWGAYCRYSKLGKIPRLPGL